jgi:hypothetical protein
VSKDFANPLHALLWPAHAANTLSPVANLAAIPLPYVLSAAALAALWVLLASWRADRRSVHR